MIRESKTSRNASGPSVDVASWSAWPPLVPPLPWAFRWAYLSPAERWPSWLKEMRDSLLALSIPWFGSRFRPMISSVCL